MEIGIGTLRLEGQHHILLADKGARGLHALCDTRVRRRTIYNDEWGFPTLQDAGERLLRHMPQPCKRCLRQWARTDTTEGGTHEA